MTAPIFVTGVAGFIGFHLAQRLLSEGQVVVGLDNINSYYDPQLKLDRLRLLTERGLEFHQLDLADIAGINGLFEKHKFQKVIHLAAQAGVRYSKTNPQAYVTSNLEGFLTVLEACRHFPVEHLIYASSSSVYGANRSMPFSVSDMTDRPISLYGATKKANELMAHSYGWMYGVPSTGLRFFTVYGPWGRPDMALYLFASAILEKRPLQLFNQGNLKRDFTYVDDVVESIWRLLDKAPQGQPGVSAPSQVFNIGNHSPVHLRHFLRLIESNLGCEAEVELLPMQDGDVAETYADVAELEGYVGFRPDTPLEVGIERAMTWYMEYRKLRGL